MFKEVNIENFTFKDLNIRIGKPYLYRHDKCCDHIIVFNDIKFLYIFIYYIMRYIIEFTKFFFLMTLFLLKNVL